MAPSIVRSAKGLPTLFGSDPWPGGLDWDQSNAASIKYLSVVGGRKKGVSFLKEVRAFMSQQVKEKTFYLGNLTLPL